MQSHAQVQAQASTLRHANVTATTITSLTTSTHLIHPNISLADLVIFLAPTSFTQNISKMLAATLRRNVPRRCRPPRGYRPMSSAIQFPGPSGSQPNSSIGEPSRPTEPLLPHGSSNSNSNSNRFRPPPSIPNPIYIPLPFYFLLTITTRSSKTTPSKTPPHT